MSEHDLDLVLYGATGFTGQLAAAYLRRVRPKLRWALGGRNAVKLEAAREALPKVDGAFEPEIIVADSSDGTSLAAMCERTAVVLNTAGPFARLAPTLAAACVETGTDYLDLTGEPHWVQQLIATHHEAAREKGVRMIPCVGFDSIPHDLGALYTAQQLGAKGPIRIREYMTGKAVFSGGTWNTALEGMGKGRKIFRAIGGASGSAKRKRKRRRARVHHCRELGHWALPLPTVDPLIVKRSASLCEDFGTDFEFELYIQVGVLAGAGLLAGVGLVAGLAQIPFARRALGRLRPQGEGPSSEARAKSWVRCTFIGEAEGRTVRCQVTGNDPGYGGTAIMCVHAALCLIDDRDALPEVYGVVTPASALGNTLIERLQRSGFEFRVVEA